MRVQVQVKKIPQTKSQTPTFSQNKNMTENELNAPTSIPMANVSDVIGEDLIAAPMPPLIKTMDTKIPAPLETVDPIYTRDPLGPMDPMYRSNHMDPMSRMIPMVPFQPLDPFFPRHNTRVGKSRRECDKQRCIMSNIFHRKKATMNKFLPKEKKETATILLFHFLEGSLQPSLELWVAARDLLHSHHIRDIMQL